MPAASVRVWNYDSFESNFGFRVTTYLKETYMQNSDECFSFNIFPKHDFVTELSPRVYSYLWGTTGMNGPWVNLSNITFCIIFALLSGNLFPTGVKPMDPDSTNLHTFILIYFSLKNPRK